MTTRAEARRLDLEEPPEELCLPDKPLADIDVDAPAGAIQDAPYIIYKRFDLPAGDGMSSPEIIYAVSEPTDLEIRLIAAALRS